MLRFVLVLAVMAVALSSLVVLASIWRRGQLRRWPYLAGITVASFLYAFGYGLELAGDTVDWKLATFRIQHLGIAFAPPLLAMVAGRFEFGRLLHARATRAVLFGLAALTYLVVVTGPSHGLYHVAPRLDSGGPFPVLAFDRGPWYLAFHVYLALVLLASNVVFARAWRRARPAERGQARTLLLATLIPWAVSLPYLAGWVPWGLDPSPYGLAATSLFLFLGVTRHALVDVVPIARELVFERMHDPVVVVDLDGTVVDRNASGAALLAAAEVPSAGEAGRLERYPALARVAAEATRADAHPELDLDGRAYACGVVELNDARGRPRGRAIVLRDVTRYKEMQRMLRELATTDDLTEIPNRRHFLDMAERFLAQSQRSGRPIAWIVFDVDRFKRVNDRYGHDAGDRVLRAVAEVATGSVRDADLVGRVGGEEFAVCLPDTGLEGACRVAERLRAAVAARQVAIATGTVSVTISVGVCATVGGELDLDTVLALADAGLYQAKREGRDRVVAIDPAETRDAVPVPPA